MPDLLERAGFKLRSKNRADCARCEGHSFSTVSYTDEVAHCFRCQWKANVVTLSKELGLWKNSGFQRLHGQHLRSRSRHRAVIGSFERWRDHRIRVLSGRYRDLRFQAQLGREVLLHYPTCAPALDALARFYHEESKILRQLDFLACAKASPWLETNATICDVFRTWRRSYAKQ